MPSEIGLNEGFFHLLGQPFLIACERQGIIAPLVDDLLGDLFLTKVDPGFWTEV